MFGPGPGDAKQVGSGRCRRFWGEGRTVEGAVETLRSDETTGTGAGDGFKASAEGRAVVTVDEGGRAAAPAYEGTAAGWGI